MPEKFSRLVVVGASLAGLRAVETARREGFEGTIELVGAEPHLPYDRPPLSKAFLAPEGPRAVEPFKASEELEGLGVHLHLGEPAIGLDLATQTLHTTRQALDYDRLLIATGASPKPFPGLGRLNGVVALRTVEDAVTIRQALEDRARVVVIGAGFIGSEVASAARKRGLEVTIVEAASLPLTRSVGSDIGAVCADLHRAAGTDLRLGVGVAGLVGDAGAVRGVELNDGEVLPADLVVVGTGVAPATSWLVDSGLALHEVDGGIVCNEYLQTSDPQVYAAGDVAHVPQGLFDGELMRLEHWTNASDQAMAAVKHMLGVASAKPFDAVPYFWSDWYEHRIQFVGTPRADQVVVAKQAADRFVALYRRGDQVAGALAVDRPRDIMKLRRYVAAGAPFAEALEFVSALT